MEVHGDFDDAISQAWREAGTDLGIRVIAPFQINIDGGEVVIEACILDFGKFKGTVALSKMTSHHQKALAEIGYFTSILFPTYRSYSREHFIDTLNDWQWLGRPEEKPVWYTGKPWS
jgi:hypothetical protein